MDQESDLHNLLWDLGKTPIKVDRLESLISDYLLIDVKRELMKLMDGFKNGFRIQYTGPRVSFMSNNLMSAELHHKETLNKLRKEVELKRMLGPFAAKPISNLRVSPLCLTPKDDGSWRLITHLSFPPNNSINDHIDPDLCRVVYSSLDKIVEMISNLGPSAKCGVIVIKSAFRLLIVSPSDFDLLEIHFGGNFYVDKCLPMGCSLSCSLFEKFSTFLQWSVEQRSDLNTLDHYLDDFIFAGRSNNDDCLQLM